VTVAHIGGVPVEEGVRVLAPAAAAILYLAAGALVWLRRR
jgi:hypothetical protein